MMYRQGHYFLEKCKKKTENIRTFRELSCCMPRKWKKSDSALNGPAALNRTDLIAVWFC